MISRGGVHEKGHCVGKGILGTGAIGGNCPLETGRGSSCTSNVCMRSSLHDREPHILDRLMEPLTI